MRTCPREHDAGSSARGTHHVEVPTKNVYIDFPDNWQTMTEAEKDAGTGRAITPVGHATLGSRVPPKTVFSSIPKGYFALTSEVQEAWGLQPAMTHQQRLWPSSEGD